MTDKKLTEEQFRDALLAGLSELNESIIAINDELDVVRTALEMLCARHGDDPEALIKAARQNVKSIKQESGE